MFGTCRHRQLSAGNVQPGKLTGAVTLVILFLAIVLLSFTFMLQVPYLAYIAAGLFGLGFRNFSDAELKLFLQPLQRLPLPAPWPLQYLICRMPSAPISARLCWHSSSATRRLHL